MSNPSTASILVKITSAAHAAQRYSVPLFLVFLVSIYGFLMFRIVSLNQVAPEQSIIAAKLKTAGVPHIDQAALDKIQQLQDNSVEVQSLFDKARSSPFQE